MGPALRPHCWAVLLCVPLKGPSLLLSAPLFRKVYRLRKHFSLVIAAVSQGSSWLPHSSAPVTRICSLPRLKAEGCRWVSHSLSFGGKPGHGWGRRSSCSSPPWLGQFFLPERTGLLQPCLGHPQGSSSSRVVIIYLHPHLNSEKLCATVTAFPDIPCAILPPGLGFCSCCFECRNSPLGC